VALGHDWRRFFSTVIGVVSIVVPVSESVLNRHDVSSLDADSSKKETYFLY
jgi:hypothetical protein